MPTSSQVSVQSMSMLEILSTGIMLNPVFFIGLASLALLSIGYVLFNAWTDGKGE